MGNAMLAEIQDSEFVLQFIPAPQRKNEWSLEQFLIPLSKDARNVVFFVLKEPELLLRVANKKAQARKLIRGQYKRIGWTPRQTQEAFREVRQAVKEFE